ncbi:PGF-pre-PGF domain-containing protein [Candidatus Woesearchaeota archaeon]|nr:PGF-pre-PGF domain-containing protein [Candidatus Woesearchaeota archaeon]
MKKKREILVFTFFILAFLFLVYGLSSFIIVGKSIFDTKAVQQTASVSIIIPDQDIDFNDIEIDFVNHTFHEHAIRKFMPLITGLNESWTMNFSIRNSTFPYDWNISQPSSSDVESVLRYFEIKIGNTSANGTQGGSYRLYFNMSKSFLGSNSTSDVKMYIFENSGGWTELSTTIASENSVSALFYATSTHFSRFLIGIESASSDSNGSGGTGSSGGGGGGSGKEEKAVYSVALDKETIKIEIDRGEEKEEFLQIKNNGNKKLSLSIKAESDSNFLFIEDDLQSQTLELEVSETKYVKIKASALNLKEGVHVGKIVIENSKLTEVVPVVLEVKSPGKALFDVEVGIPEEYSVVKAGGKISFNVLLYNLGVTGKVDVEVTYKILDLDENVVVEETDKETVETQLQKVKSLKLPPFLKAGKYVLAAEVKYFDGEKETVSTSTSIFEVSEGAERELPLYFGLTGLSSSTIIAALFLTIVMIMILMQFRVLDTLKRTSRDLSSKKEPEEIKKDEKIDVKKEDKSKFKEKEYMPINKPIKKGEELSEILEEVRRRIK